MPKEIKDTKGKVVGTLLTDDDVSMDGLKGKKLAVIGYASQGRAQSLCYRDSGVDVIVGQRKDQFYDLAVEDGWVPGETLFEIEEAAKQADIVHLLIADLVQSTVYEEHIKPHLTEGKTLAFSHGFNITFGWIKPPEDVNVVMLAPKGPGVIVRREYEAGFGLPALWAVQQDASGDAKDIILGMCKAVGATRAGVLETSFREECCSDLFGEQVDLCGGVTWMIKNAYETLIARGYNPVLAYWEIHHELWGLLAPLSYKKGNVGMLRKVSVTARDGAIQTGPYVMDKTVKERMGKSLDRIESGEYAEGLKKRYQEKGFGLVDEPLDEMDKTLLEVVGKQVRKVIWPNDPEVE
ncbi:ketol-acid reductoisomerase [Candidatus Altiarchaeota archaeon]